MSRIRRVSLLPFSLTAASLPDVCLPAARVSLACLLMLAFEASLAAGEPSSPPAENSPARSSSTEDTASPASASQLDNSKLDEDFPRVTLPDAISGQEICFVSSRGEKATVLVCMAIDCPISTEYVPTIVAIAEKYRDLGVVTLGVDPNGGQSLEEMAEYAKQFEIPFPFTKDAGGKVSRSLLFSVTPEARVYDATGKLVYSGRIDDRYRRGGASDKNVARDLEQALDEVLAGKPVSASRTKAMGCPLQVAEPRR